MTTETLSKPHVEKKTRRSGIKVTYKSSSESDDDDEEMEIGDGHSSEGESEEISDDHEKEEVEELQTEPDGDNSGGLANVMANILSKKTPNESKTILAKALTSRQILQKKQKDTNSDISNESKEVAIIEKRKLWENMCRVKPDPLDRDRERQLQRIATRGVVQLFNAVKKQQKTVEEKLVEAGSSEKRREMALKSVTKGAFLDLLKGTNASVASDPVSTKTTQKRKTDAPSEDSKPKWSILREDFMMGAALKDWDRNSSDDETNINNKTVEDSESEDEE